MLDLRPSCCGLETHQCHFVVSLSKNINPSLVLVQPRKTCPFITEILLMGRKESNQTKIFKLLFSNNPFRNTIRVSNRLEQDQARHSVGPDLGPNCLQRLSENFQATHVNENGCESLSAGFIRDHMNRDHMNRVHIK